MHVVAGGDGFLVFDPDGFMAVDEGVDVFMDVVFCGDFLAVVFRGGDFVDVVIVIRGNGFVDVILCGGDLMNVIFGGDCI